MTSSRPLAPSLSFHGAIMANIHDCMEQAESHLQMNNYTSSSPNLVK